MIRPQDLRQFVIKPVLTSLAEKIGITETPVAEALLLATAAQETHCGEFLAQVDGPALGIYQMEPNTAQDIYFNFLQGQWNRWANVVNMWAIPEPRPAELWRQMPYNLALATLFARILYFRVQEPLPKSTDAEDLWPYYKAHWNSYQGAATEEEFIDNVTKYTDLSVPLT